ncbi:MAG: sulfite exporter TauE/SafE family protein [Cytophagales bacterium]|nr:sulfite exporter TauE/SafE family protein [Cytophagales bacterium]
MNQGFYLFFLLALLAEIIGTVSGFGSSILFVPLASLFIDFKLVLGITAVFHVFSNLSKIFLFQKGIDKTIALKLGIPAVIFVILGAILTQFVPLKEIELSMNLIILALTIFLISGAGKNIQQTNINLYTGGIISGFLAGLIGTGGAIRGITLAAFGLEKDVFIATSALIDLGVDSSRAVVYIVQGYFLQEHPILIPFLIVIAFLGSYIGKKVLSYIPEKYFHYVVLGVIGTISILQTIQYFKS